MNEVTTAARTLPQIANEIRYLDRQAKRLVLGHAIEIGNRLIEAKELVGHGEWGNWLKDEFDYSQSSAQNFMRIAEEYGETQMGLFGPEAKSQTLGNLPYTKALKLLAVPSEEREEFVETHDVEGMSTRELEQAIRERDELKKQLAAERDAQEGAALKISELEENLQAAHDAGAEDAQKAEAYRAELEELRSRPIEVAVQEPDPGELQTAIEDAVEEARLELKAASDKELTAAREAAKKEKAALTAKLEKAEKAAEAAKKAAEATKSDGAAETLKAEIAAALAEAERLKKQLAMASNANVPIFQVHFRDVQDGFNKMFTILYDTEGETGDKLAAALRSLLQAELDRLNGGPHE